MIVAPLIGRLISALVQRCARRPVVTVVVSLALAAAGVLYTVYTLTFVTSPLRLLPREARYVVLLNEYLHDFGELNDIVVAVESPTPQVSTEYAARLVHDLRQAGLESRITYRLDSAYFNERGLLYLSLDELTALRDRLIDYREFIESYAARPTLAQLLDGLNQQIASAMMVGFFDLGLGGERRADLRFLQTVLAQVSGRLDGPSAYVSPWSTAFSLERLADPNAGYFFSSDRRLLFLFVQERRQEGNFTDNRERIEMIRGAITRLAGEFPAVQAGVTGGPAISTDEMATAFGDSKVATVLAFAMTLGLLVLLFRRVAKPLLMLATLAVSLAWSMGVITLVVGQLSIFSVMFISIVVGIGIDYGIYFLYRYEEERWLGATRAGALGRTAERAGPGMLLGALTAAGAFFVLVLTDFRGIREFGFVSGTAIMLAFLAMITLFPALLMLVDRRRAGAATRSTAAGPGPRAAWLEGVTGYRKTVLTAATGLTAVAIWGAVGVDFNYNMLELQAKGVESVRWEQRILAQAGRSGMAALTTASSLDELRRKEGAFAALPSVSEVESVLMVIPDQQPEKIALIHQLSPLVSAVRVARPPALQPGTLREPLETLRRRLGLAVEEVENTTGGRDVRETYARVGEVLAKLHTADPKVAGPALARLQGDMARDFAQKLQRFQDHLRPEPITPGDLPPELQQRYIGLSGRYLIRIHPAVDIWQREGAERFIRDLRTVDPDVTGPPVTSFEAIRLIRQGYVDGTLYALALVAGVSALLLRSARGTALALAPLALAVVWTLGLMRLFDLPFNIANVWALPLIIGTAAEFGLNIYVRFLESRASGGPVLVRSTVMAVTLNGLTTIGGFGSLMVAHHRGIWSLGLLLTLGASASLLSSLAVLPVLINRFGGPFPRAPQPSTAVARKPAEVTVTGARAGSAPASRQSWGEVRKGDEAPVRGPSGATTA